MAIADGMGGTSNGYLASKIAANIACDVLENSIEGNCINEDKQLKILMSAIYKRIQDVIGEQISINTELQGMGTTLAGMLIYKEKYVWGNIGDSRIYKYEDDTIVKITEDHSYINELERNNDTGASDEIMNSYGHLITRCLDGGTDEPDIFPEEKEFESLETGDFFLLCSDGLILKNKNGRNKYLKFIRKAIKKRNLEKLAEKLIEYSFDQGSTDNISLILFIN